MSSLYYALIADAIASRRLPPARRGALQTTLRAVARDLTRRHRRAVAAAFAPTLGDELQGLLSDRAALWPIAHALRAAVPDVDWVIACGRGAMATPRARTARDGRPCFRRARSIEAARAGAVFTFRGSGRHWAFRRTQPSTTAGPPTSGLAALLRAGATPAQAAAVARRRPQRRVAPGRRMAGRWSPGA
jgi:hypothetical protein